MNTAPNTYDALPLQPSQFISTELLRLAPLDIAAEELRIRQWNMEGGSMSPSEVARLNVSPEVIDHLRESCRFEFSSLTEHTDALDLQTSYYIQQIEQSFIDVCKSDMSFQNLRPNKFEVHTYIGQYSDKAPDKHLDEQSANVVLRYGVTIAGPGTMWITGVTNPQDFNGDGNCIPGSASDLLSLDPSLPNVVNQFACDSYPHSPPTVTEPVFRFTLFASVYL